MTELDSDEEVKVKEVQDDEPFEGITSLIRRTELRIYGNSVMTTTMTLPDRIKNTESEVFGISYKPPTHLSLRDRINLVVAEL